MAAGVQTRPVPFCFEVFDGFLSSETHIADQVRTNDQSRPSSTGMTVHRYLLALVQAEIDRFQDLQHDVEIRGLVVSPAEIVEVYPVCIEKLVYTR